MIERSLPFTVSLLVLSLPAFALQTAPPAPVLAAPASGAASVQPIALRWNPIVDPDGPIGSYSWDVSTSSTFGSVIASGFNNWDGVNPIATDARVSGLANGTYFWRVRGAQDLGSTIGFVDSPWSAPRSFTVTGLGPAPTGVPVLSAPGTSFHPFEFFDIQWGAVAGAQYYILEADDEATFSFPITLSSGPTIVFGTVFHAGWGNEIPNIFYRVRAVSADNVWGRPSAPLTVHITNAAPVGTAPTPLFPINGQSVQLPFTMDWSDTANAQIPGYDLDIDNEPNFLGAVGVLLVQGVSRSDYMVVPDPLVEGINHLPPGTYFWRVRALRGSAFGPWSAGQRFVVTASPPTPPGVDLFAILTDPGSVEGGNSTAARVILSSPAPAGGTLVHVASDFPGVEMPTSTVLVPAGSTDALVAPITTPPVAGASIGDLRAALGMVWQENSIGCFPLMWGAALEVENTLGGSTVNGSIALLGPAPAGGFTVSLVSSDTALARVPASVFIPAGATGGTFTVATSPVTVPTRIVLQCASALEGYRAPETWLTLQPAGSPAPPSALSTITLTPSTVLGGASGSGTVTLTAPAPAGGALIRLNGSMEGTVVVPGSVTVPAGALSASFPVTPPPVAQSHWVLIQSTFGFSGMVHATTLRVDPAPAGVPPLFAIDVRPNALVGGTISRGTVLLSVPAPPGGTAVALVSSNPAALHVPPSVSVAAGNSTASFAVTTSPVASFTEASVTGSAGGASKTAFLSIGADPNAPLQLLSVTPSVSGAVGGNSINVTLFLNKSTTVATPVALASSNTVAARVPASVTVPAGLGFVAFNITTSPVAVDTQVVISGTLGVTQTATITVLAPPLSLASLTLSPASVVGGSPSSGTATLSAVAPAGGTVVTLSSGNSAIASVPASVTVAAGATSAAFAVTTSAVSTSTAVTITGTVAGLARSATLTVAPNAAGFRGATAGAADVGGDGNGFEVGAANAFADDAANAVDNNSGTASTTLCTSSSRDSHQFFGFGASVPAGSGVAGIEVRLDARADGTNGAPKMCVQLSGDGGATWTAPKSTPTLTATMTTYVLGGAADNWGRAWTAAALSDASFRVRITDVASSTARDFSLDWIAVRVTSGEAAPIDTTPPTVALNAPLGGTTLSGTVTMAATASDDTGVARVEFLADGALLGSDATAPYSFAWNSGGAANGSHSLAARAVDGAGNQSIATVTIAVDNGTVTPPVVHLALGSLPASLARGGTFTATGTVTNAGGSAASGYTVLIAFTPTDSMRLESPQGSTQNVAAVAAGGSQAVSWQLRTDRAASATVTMTLRNPSGAVVETASKTLTITN